MVNVILTHKHTHIVIAGIFHGINGNFHGWAIVNKDKNFHVIIYGHLEEERFEKNLI